MKADNSSTDHNRTIRLTEININGGNPRKELDELLLKIGYHSDLNEGDMIKGITLDSIVLPYLVNLINADAVRLKDRELPPYFQQFRQQMSERPMELRRRTSLTDERPLMDLEIEFKGTIEEVHEYAWSCGFTWVERQQYLFGGYYVNHYRRTAKQANFPSHTLYLM